MPIKLTSEQDTLARKKIVKRLEKIAIDSKVPLYYWELVKSWTAVSKRKGAKINLTHLKAKYRPVAVEINNVVVTRAKLVEAGVPFCLTVNLGLA